MPTGQRIGAYEISTDDVCRVVGERVRDLRVGLGLTMERFADAAGLSLGMLSKIENGQTHRASTR